jgi:nuclear mRNA export protein PCID2/THP1
MDFYNYLATLNRLWNNEDGQGVSRFITIRGKHASNPHLYVANPEPAVDRSIHVPLNDVVSAHIKVLFYLHENRKRSKILRDKNQIYS